MAAGLPTSYTVEIEFAASVYTDVTSYVDMLQGMTVTAGRTTEFDDTPAGMFTCRLRSDDGRFVPDNPLSPYFPNVIEGKRLRLKVTKGATTSTRFLGRITAWDASFDNGNPGELYVTVTAADVFALMARRTLTNMFAESWYQLARSTSALVDVWPFDDSTSLSTALRSGSQQLSASVLRYASSGTSNATSASGLAASACVALEPNDKFVGPVVYAPLKACKGNAVSQTISFRVDGDSVAVSGANKVICAGYAASGAVTWALQLDNTGTTTDLVITTGTTSLTATLVSNFTSTAWHSLQLIWNGTDTEISLRRCDDATILYDLTQPPDWRNVAYLTLGGLRSGGKNSQCTKMEVGPLACSDTVGLFGDRLTIGGATFGSLLAGVYAGFADCAATINGTALGAFDRFATYSDTTGRTALACVQELARSVGANVYPDLTSATADKTFVFALPSTQRLSTVALTIAAESDGDASNGLPLARNVDSKPTRVTASFTGGSVTVVGSETDVRIDESVVTVCASEDAARSVAAQRLNRSASLRVSGLKLALHTAQTDRYVAAWALKPGQRVQVTELPSTVLGYTYADMYAQGWTEFYQLDEASITYDFTPADKPPDGVFDDASYGRFSTGGAFTVTGGTALGTSSTGTIIITTTSGVYFTTNASMYPMDLDWNSERVTVTSAPAAGSGGTQTLTLTARGVAPTVARVHATGETIDVWTAARFAF